MNYSEIIDKLNKITDLVYQAKSSKELAVIYKDNINDDLYKAIKGVQIYGTLEEKNKLFSLLTILEGSAIYLLAKSCNIKNQEITRDNAVQLDGQTKYEILYFACQDKEDLKTIDENLRKCFLMRKKLGYEQRCHDVVPIINELQKVKDKLNAPNLSKKFLKKVKLPYDEVSAKEAGEIFCYYIDKIVNDYKAGNIELWRFKNDINAILCTPKEYESVGIRCSQNYPYPNKNKPGFIGPAEVTDYANLLKTHRGYKEILYNLLFAAISIVSIVGIPVALAASVVSKISTSRWTVFQPNTDTGQKLKEVLKETKNITDPLKFKK